MTQIDTTGAIYWVIPAMKNARKYIDEIIIRYDYNDPIHKIAVKDLHTLDESIAAMQAVLKEVPHNLAHALEVEATQGNYLYYAVKEYKEKHQEMPQICQKKAAAILHKITQKGNDDENDER